MAAEGDIARLLPITIYRGSTVTTAAGAIAVLRDWLSGNADRSLRAELLTVKQNLASGVKGDCIANAVRDAEDALAADFGRNPTIDAARLAADRAALVAFDAGGCR